MLRKPLCKKIGFAVLATTMALVAVFIPVAFLTGAVGRLFREFGITLTVAVALSSFVALTLTPVLCSRLLQRVRSADRRRSWAERSFDSFFDGLTNAYRATLRFSLKMRPLVILVIPMKLVMSTKTQAMMTTRNPSQSYWPNVTT